MIKICAIICGLLFSLAGNSQKNEKPAQFILTGKIAGNTSGYVVLWYSDDRNLNLRDTILLKEGIFYTTGKINTVSQALLWTEPKNTNFDDSSVIHFLLTPDTVTIDYAIHNGVNAIILGSKPELEQQIWNTQKVDLIKDKAVKFKKIISLVRLRAGRPDSSSERAQAQIQKSLDTVNFRIRTLDSAYISEHPDSYVSMYLLWVHRRRLSLSTVQELYQKSGSEMKMSSLGHDVLLYVYPLTNDSQFRKRNPLLDPATEAQLQNIHSLYDLNLADTAGKKIQFAAFKDKIIVIDFWASWCIPCVENIPKLNALENKYKNAPVRFISISLDKDENLWKQAVVMHHLHGANFSDLKGFVGLAALYFKVIFVATYIVVNQDGKVINYNALSLATRVLTACWTN